MSNLLLDTHAWIWYVNGDKSISKSSQDLIENAVSENKIYLAAISLWEIAMLEKRKRIILSLSCLDWINTSIKILRLEILPLIPIIAVDACQLPGEFHGDPADQQIVATARHHSLSILTKDEKILNYSKNKFVKAISI